MTPFEQRFWEKVDKSGDCWLWTGSNTGIYGLFTVASRQAGAHRVSWELHYGPIPEGMCVCHHCDTPLCIRPDHLFVGTKSNNNADRDAKGRGARQKGVAHGGAKLTEENVLLIRRLCASGLWPQRVIGRWFGVCQKTVCNIYRRENWGHI